MQRSKGSFGSVCSIKESLEQTGAMKDDGKEWTSESLRNSFLDYFQTEHGHRIVPSSSVVPLNDPSILFVNSGMVQFKDVFCDCLEQNSCLSTVKRAVNVQRCIRAGGKHNDLDDVGKDSYHHTFFEMLGTWSFGDYFKKEATAMVWDFLVNVLAIERDRLYVSYFSGCDSIGLEEDTETKLLWKEIGVEETHIVGFGLKENFWEMGEAGPCGVCTEIHFDRVGGRDASSLLNKDDPDVVEIWNIVFMEFTKEKDGKIEKLKKKHVDTGAGLERILSVLQEKRTNYSTDIFSPYMQEIKKKTSTREYADKYGEEDVEGVDMAYRIVSDHIRTLVVAIGDGITPSADGRGYVLRRIARRGIRYFVDKLGGVEGGFADLSMFAVKTMESVFPEIKTRKERIRKTIEEEEKLFLGSLAKGRKQLDKVIAETREKGDIMPGKDLWRLYDTFGFPVDLTRLMAQEKGVGIDEEGFVTAEKESKEISKQKGEKKRIELGVKDISFLSEMNVKPTDDGFKYEKEEIEASIVCFVVDGGELRLSPDLDEKIVGVILDRTNFYSEKGGQMSDKGVLVGDGEFVVEDVQSMAGYVVHYGAARGKFGKRNVLCSIDMERREALCRAHTANHLFGCLMHKMFGRDCSMAGGVVYPDKVKAEVRLGSISEEDFQKFYSFFRQAISEEREVTTRVLGVEDALKLPGIVCMFEDRYPEIVRVVCIDGLEEYSGVEICGGTHITNTKELKEIVFCSEKGISRGNRRVLFLIGDEATKSREREKKIVERVKEIDNEAVLREMEEIVKDEAVSVEIKTEIRKKVLAKRKENIQKEKAKQEKRIEEKKKQALVLCLEKECVFVLDDIRNKKELMTMLALFEQKEKSSALVASYDGQVQYAIFVSKKEERTNARSVGEEIRKQFGGRLWKNKEESFMGSIEGANLESLSTEFIKKLSFD